MSTKDFIEHWVNDSTTRQDVGNIHLRGNKLLSYGTCICERLSSTYIVNITKYSKSTSKHQTYVKDILDKLGIGYVTIDDMPIYTTKLT